MVALELTEKQREEIVRLIQAGKPLPARYRASLFEDAASTELIWPGKTSEVERAVLPLQSVEQIDEPRTDVNDLDLFSLDTGSGRQMSGWSNKLIWGDNKLVLSSLANGPMRDEIERAGGLKLVYIDPPFDVGADFSFDVEIGDAEVTKAPSVVEEVAYRDTWGKGRDSYIAMMNERIRLIYALLADDGTIFLHCDYRTSGINRAILDEVFGQDRILNEVIWIYGLGGSSNRYFPRKHDTLFWYSRSEDYFFEPPMVPASSQRMKGRDKKAPDYWDIPSINNMAGERLAYPTQKPEALLERVISSTTRPGDLVADFFCGSGTTLAVAEKLGRKWIGADLGRFAIHTSRKRLIEVQRELRKGGQSYRAFEVLNLGQYERQHFVGIDPALPSEKRAVLSAEREEMYVEMILQAYKAERAEALPPFHGVSGPAAVYVGPLDAPVTQNDVRKLIDAAKKAGVARADILGFEFEMGIKPAMADEAKEEGLTLTLRYIPNDVFDKRAISKGQVRFYDVGYLEAKGKVKGRTVEVSLSDFGVFYAQEDAEQAAAGLRAGQSKTIIDRGQVVRVEKDRAGKVKKDVLTKTWTDWIDYWAVDFDFESKKEILTVVEDDEEKQLWSGRYVFENQWQSFRTRNNRDLETTSAPHTYDEPGEYKVAVKAIDVFGNDTTKLIKVKVK